MMNKLKKEEEAGGTSRPVPFELHPWDDNIDDDVHNDVHDESHGEGHDVQGSLCTRAHHNTMITTSSENSGRIRLTSLGNAATSLGIPTSDDTSLDVSLTSSRRVGPERPDPAPVAVTSSVADHNNPHTTRNKLACALKALKCSSRASKGDQDFDRGNYQNHHSAYDMSLFDEGHSHGEISHPRSMAHLPRQTPIEKLRNDHPQSFIQKKMDQQPGQSNYGQYLNTVTFDQNIAPRYLEVGVESSNRPSSSSCPPPRSIIQQQSPMQTPFEKFANFDSSEVADDARGDDVDSVLQRVADTTHYGIAAGPSRSTTLFTDFAVPRCEFDVFEDENDHNDENMENGWTFATEGLHHDQQQQQQQQQHRISGDPTGTVKKKHLDDVRDSNDCNIPQAAPSFLWGEDAPDGGTTLSWTLPAESTFLGGRQASNDSNETPTTCNRNQDIDPTTPETLAVSTINQRREDREECFPNAIDIFDRHGGNDRIPDDCVARRWGDESLKQILHHSLSLGDALSPTDEESMSNWKQCTIESDQKDTVLTESLVDATLLLPDMFGLERHLRSHDEDGKIDDEDVNRFSSSPPAQRCDGIVSHTRSDIPKTMSKVMSIGPTVTYKTQRDDASFSTVSSFTIPFQDGKPTISMRHSIQLPQRDSEGGHKAVTPHPFFWRSHPTVTVKSYNFQQPKGHNSVGSIPA